MCDHAPFPRIGSHPFWVVGERAVVGILGVVVGGALLAPVHAVVARELVPQRVRCVNRLAHPLADFLLREGLAPDTEFVNLAMKRGSPRAVSQITADS